MITLSELFLNYLQPVLPGLAVTVILLTDQVTMANFFMLLYFFMLPSCVYNPNIMR